MKNILNMFKTLSGHKEEDGPEAAPGTPRQHTAPNASAAKDAMTFAQLNLVPEILRAVTDQGYTNPTPIQQAAIPYVLDGRDLLGCAQTGTGKTAAFAIPLLQRLSREGRGLRALILTPTRELAIQVADSFKTYGKYLDLRTVVVYGGVGIEPQKRALAGRVDILVATPGRLLDLMGQRSVSLQSINTFVLDEADRMLDMGFIHDVRRIIKAVPVKRQTLLFSATMPRDIQDLAMSALNNPAKVEVAPVASTSEQVTQSLYYVSRNDKRPLLLHLLEDPSLSRVLIFTRTKAIANRVSELLTKSGVPAEAIHGNKSQSARQRALESFRAGKTRALVASDLAARGLDIDEVSHVINFDLPNVAETYVHRIGRTGRAAHRGLAISFCDGGERAFLKDIESLIRRKVPVVENHPFAPVGGLPKDEAPPENGRGGRGGGGGGGGGGGRSGGGRPQQGRGGQRPQGQSERPQGQSERPQGQGQRPQGQGQRPQGQGQRPQGQGQRPQGQGQRPQGQGQGQRPQGQGEGSEGGGKRPSRRGRSTPRPS